MQLLQRRFWLDSRCRDSGICTAILQLLPKLFRAPLAYDDIKRNGSGRVRSP